MYNAKTRSPPHTSWLPSRSAPRMDKSLRPTCVERMPQARSRRPCHPVECPARPPDLIADGCGLLDVNGGRPSKIVGPVDDRETSNQVNSALKTIVANAILQPHSSRSILNRNAVVLRGHGLKSMQPQERPLFRRTQKVCVPESRDFNIQIHGDTARSKENMTSKSSLVAYSPKKTTRKFKSSLSVPLHLAKLISRASRDLLSKNQTRTPTVRLGKRNGFPFAPVTFRGDVIGKPKNIDLELAHVEDAPRKAPSVPTVRIAPDHASLTGSEATVVGECAEGKWRIAEHGKVIHPVQPLTFKLRRTAFKNVSPSTLSDVQYPSVGLRPNTPLPCSPQPPQRPNGVTIHPVQPLTFKLRRTAFRNVSPSTPSDVQHPSVGFRPNTPLPCSPQPPQRPNDVPLLHSTLSPRRSLPALSTRSTASVYSTASIDLVHAYPHAGDDNESVFDYSSQTSGPAFYFLPTESPDENGDWGFMDNDVDPETSGLPLHLARDGRRTRAL